MKRSLADRAVGGFLWQSGGAGVKGVLQILLLGILARLITPAEFGVVGAALVVVGISTLFSQLGVGPAIVYQSRLTQEHIRVAFWISVGLSGLLLAVLWGTTPLIADFFGMPALRRVLLVVSLVFPVRGLGVVAESLLQRELRFRALSLVDLFSYGVGYGLLGVTLGLLGFGYWALAWGHVGQSILQTASLLALRPHPVRPCGDKNAMKELMRYGAGHTLARGANYVALQADNVVAGRWLGAEALGLYGRAYQLLVAPATLLGTALDRVLFPSMSSIKEDRHRLETVYRRGIAAVGLVALPVSGVVVILAPEIVLTLLGPEWSEAVLPLQILASGLLFRTSYKISDSLVRATGEVFRRAWRQGVYAAFIIAGSIIGARWGIAGIAAGTLVGIIVNFILMTHMGLRITGLPLRDFAAAHRFGVRLALGSTVACAIIASTTRALQLSAPLRLLLAMGGGATLVRVLLLGKWPEFFLGRDGIWIVVTLRRNLPRSVSNILLPAKLRQLTPTADAP